MEARDKGNGQKESHLPTESSSDQSNPVSAIINPQSTPPPNSRLKLLCRYVEWMSQVIIILSSCHQSEYENKGILAREDVISLPWSFPPHSSVSTIAIGEGTGNEWK